MQSAVGKRWTISLELGLTDPAILFFWAWNLYSVKLVKFSYLVLHGIQNVIGWSFSLCNRCHSIRSIVLCVCESPSSTQKKTLKFQKNNRNSIGFDSAVLVGSMTLSRKKKKKGSDESGQLLYLKKNPKTEKAHLDSGILELGKRWMEGGGSRTFRRTLFCFCWASDQCIDSFTVQEPDDWPSGLRHAAPTLRPLRIFAGTLRRHSTGHHSGTSPTTHCQVVWFF